MDYLVQVRQAVTSKCRLDVWLHSRVPEISFWSCKSRYPLEQSRAEGWVWDHIFELPALHIWEAADMQSLSLTY